MQHLMNDEVVKLLASHFYRTEDLSDWAINCLEKDFDSKSLRMLVSMWKWSPPSELDNYFQRSLKELGWDKIDKRDYLMRYAEILAREIIEDKTDPIKAALEIYDILKDLDYPSELYGFIEMDEMVWDYEYFLKTGEKGYFYHSQEKLIGEIKRISEELLKSKEKV